MSLRWRHAAGHADGAPAGRTCRCRKTTRRWWTWKPMRAADSSADSARSIVRRCRFTDRRIRSMPNPRSASIPIRRANASRPKSAWRYATRPTSQTISVTFAVANFGIGLPFHDIARPIAVTLPPQQLQAGMRDVGSAVRRAVLRARHARDCQTTSRCGASATWT